MTDNTSLSDDLIRELLTTLQSTKSFVIEQAPDVVQELVHYKLVESLIVCIICILAMFAYRYVGIRVWKYTQTLDSYSDFPFAAGLVAVFGGIPLTIATLFFLANSASTAIQIYIAPKIFLIEYLSGLVAHR
jgi:hypothetical protein